MANDIRLCDKCNHIQLKSIVPKLKKLAPDSEIQIGCKSYCGPCGKRPFLYVNGRYLSAPTEAELLAKTEPFIKKSS
ncbi:DUF1450 domain-containing protein [Paenibacillus chibensis]|uniref:DUF1450 domain-containing protein n=1 Tax=Paenibacillus chibensis TaxID=59846 RepID=A0ABU6PZV5_9BACL|nr:DUF1450 domain-containing protein [Paenibacillus chibensis]MEC0369047.1 DUF1450 domain-containing protein [Paenibacillus chibensis]MED5019706.1 DUF1450 domain-containing protein [Paenibacillus chibensis]